MKLDLTPISAIEGERPTKARARICVPLRAETVKDLDQLIASAAQMSDIVELRLDGLREKELVTAKQQLKNLIARSLVPVIITLRPSEQGGYRDLSIAT